MDSPEQLPSFRYYKTPFADGTFKEEPDTPCLGCNRIRGYVYTGPVHTEKNFILQYCICPWCIADGTAAKLFGASFNDAGTMDGVTAEVMKEIEERTPGFAVWQDWGWLTCCGDAAMFLGIAGAKELKRDFPEAVPAVMEHLRDGYDLSGKELREFFEALSKEEQPSAYVFQCLHCQTFLACVDQT